MHEFIQSAQEHFAVVNEFCWGFLLLELSYIGYIGGPVDFNRSLTYEINFCLWKSHSLAFGPLYGTSRFGYPPPAKTSNFLTIFTQKYKIYYKSCQSKNQKRRTCAEIVQQARTLINFLSIDPKTGSLSDGRQTII